MKDEYDFTHGISNPFKSDGKPSLHLYNSKNMLRPKGTLQEGSLSLHLYQELMRIFKSWTDPIADDSLSPEEVYFILNNNIYQEILAGIGKFRDEVTKNET